MEYRLISDKPAPVWLAVVDPGWRPPLGGNGPVFDMFAAGCLFRGVGLDRLPAILTTGIDVHPTDSPIFADDFDKAYEYGGLPKVVMALHARGMKRTCQVLYDDVPMAQLEELEAEYPHAHQVDGRTWLSRIADPNPAVRGYEAAYGRWIPGDPFDTLGAVFIFVPSLDAEHLVPVAEALARVAS